MRRIKSGSSRVCAVVITGTSVLAASPHFITLHGAGRRRRVTHASGIRSIASERRSLFPRPRAGSAHLAALSAAAREKGVMR
jgi:hypothetical protein